MKILFVCAGNICRSVMAECIARVRAGEILGNESSVLEFESSGITAESDSAPHPECLRALELLGINGCDTTSTMADEDHIQSSDLVITMTRQQCYVLAGRFPEHKRKFFSLLEINGAIETILGSRGSGIDAGACERPGLSPEEPDRALEPAVESLTGAPREELRPLAGVPLTIRELMTLFPSCFHQVSGVHDPLGGTQEEVERCARLIDAEVALLIRGLRALALTQASPR